MGHYRGQKYQAVWPRCIETWASNPDLSPNNFVVEPPWFISQTPSSWLLGFKLHIATCYLPFSYACSHFATIPASTHFPTTSHWGGHRRRGQTGQWSLARSTAPNDMLCVSLTTTQWTWQVTAQMDSRPMKATTSTTIPENKDRVTALRGQ